jgi:two-component system cell cycle sensor histidine kinase/response regulator CckA
MTWAADNDLVVRFAADSEPTTHPVSQAPGSTEPGPAHACDGSNSRLQRIVETQSEIAALDLDLDSVMQVICERTQELTNAEGATLLLLEGEEFFHRAATGSMRHTLGKPVPMKGTMSGRAHRTNQPVSVGDMWTAHKGDDAYLNDVCRERGIRSLLAVPLRQGGKSVGQLQVISNLKDAFSVEDVNTLELLSVVLSATMSRAFEVQALARYRTIVDEAPIGITRVTPGAKPTGANRALERMLGYTAHELASISLNDLTHPDDLEATLSHVDDLMQGRVESFQLEKRYYRKDGSSIWCRVTATREPSGADDDAYAIAMIEDITEYKAAEEQLRQSQKMEAVGQLTAGIAHDFNNLLMGMLGNAALASADADDRNSVVRHLEKVEEAGMRAASLVQQLLAFGRRQPLHLGSLDLNELCSDTISLLGSVLGEHIEIVPVLDPELRPVTSDRTQLQQALMNLALNARDAMPAGGRLTVRTGDVDFEAAEMPADLELTEGRYVVLTVEDTGSGMPPEVKERIFEPFFTTKGLAEGTGLGLSTVSGIVKQSGGDVEVASTLGEGTTFRIYLPAGKSAALAGETEVGPRHQAETGTPAQRDERPRILVVEDDGVVRQLVCAMLEDAGYDVVAASDPTSALNVVRRGNPISLVLTDLVMPQMNGRQLAAAILAEAPHTRVLFMSGYQNDELVDSALLLEKPFARDDLLGSVESALSREAAA